MLIYKQDQIFSLVIHFFSIMKFSDVFINRTFIINRLCYLSFAFTYFHSCDTHMSFCLVLQSIIDVHSFIYRFIILVLFFFILFFFILLLFLSLLLSYIRLENKRKLRMVIVQHTKNPIVLYCNKRNVKILSISIDTEMDIRA